VYKIKHNPNGTIRYKAQLFVKGYEQVEDINFDETYVPQRYIKNALMKQYQMSNLGLAKWFGMEDANSMPTPLYYKIRLDTDMSTD